MYDFDSPLLRWSRVLRATLPVALLSFPGHVGAAGNPRCEWSSGFHVPGLNAPADKILAGADGLYVAGAFRSADNQFADQIAKWDGTRWSALKPVPEYGVVYAMTEFDDGTGPRLIIGVESNNWTSVYAWSGSDWEVLGSLNGTVHALTVMPFAGKDTLIAGGILRNGQVPLTDQLVVRWDGQNWVSLLDEPPVAGVSTIRDLAVFGSGSNARLHVAGCFPSESDFKGVLVFDGLSWSNLGTGLENGGSPACARALETYDDGTGSALYVAGELTSAGGVPTQSIAKWNGSTWSAMDAGLAGFTIQDVEAIDAGAGTRLFIGGTGPNRYLAVWQNSSWQTVEGPENEVSALAELNDGSGSALYAAGKFMKSGELTTLHIARYKNSLWSPVTAKPFGKGVVGDITSLATAAMDGNDPLFFGGAFRLPGDSNGPSSTPNHLATWRPASWSPLPVHPGKIYGIDLIATGDSPGLYLAHGAVSRYHDGVLTPVGDLSQIAQGAWAGHVLHLPPKSPSPLESPIVYGILNATPGIAGWDGTAWTVPDAGLSGMLGSIWTYGLHDDGSGPALYVSGSFTQAGGNTAIRYARWDGTSWAPLGSNPNYQARALVSFDDGSGPALYAMGSFFGGFARWNGSQWTYLGFPPVAAGFDLATVFDDGTGKAIYIVGQVAAIDYRLARWDANGWTVLDSEIRGYPKALKVLDDGTGPALYLVGEFGADHGASGIARFCSPLLFADGFESGDLSQWSVASPATPPSF